VKHEFRELVYETVDGIARIRLNRPQALNAFSFELYTELRDAVRHAQHDDRVDIIVITGTGQAFNAGGDVKQAKATFEAEGWLGMYKFRDAAPWNAVRDCPKITIAAINGLCLAGGLVLASACDISLAVESATFGFNEVLVGVADRVAPSFLFGRVSAAKAKYLLLTGKRITAAEAERIGLITEVVPDDQLESRVGEVIAELRQGSPVARSLYKEFWNELMPRVQNDGEERVALAMEQSLAAHRLNARA